MNSPSPFECFGVPIEGTSLEETLKRIQDGSVHWIVTANPEILLEAKSDKTYREAITQADLRVADGVGLTWLARFFGSRLHRVTGVELAENILALAVSRGWSVAFIGGRKGVAEHARTIMQKKYPSLKTMAFDGGAVAMDGAGDDENEEALHQLTLQTPDVLLVAFGHPKQERWILKNLHQLPTVKVALGIGGAFDFWSGEASRAPRWMRGIGLEWLYRLCIEPKRWKRIWNAVIVFPVKALLSR